MDPKDLVKALRGRLGLSQEALAEAAELTRGEVNKIEAGRNQASTIRIVRGLARAADASLEDMADYLAEVVSLEELWRRVQARKHALRTKPPEPDDPYPNRTEAADICRRSGILDEAIESVINEKPPPHDLRVLDWIKLIDAREVRFRAEPTPPPVTTTRPTRHSDRPPSSKREAPSTKRGTK